MTKKNFYGCSLKDFQLGDQIGHGGFAKVFKAKSLLLVDGYVAIKRIEKKPQIQNKIETEIAIHSSLPKHPSVVELYASFQDDNYWYLVMELCTGGSLEKYLERKGHLSESEAIPLIKKVIDGVAFLHAKNVLHRDLSLRNLLLTDSQDEIKIIDFGLAVELKGRDQKVNAKVGTVNFMAPEVVKHDSYSYKADCWSVGCVLYALLFGSLPFNAETKEKIQRNIKQSKLEFPHNVKISREAKKFLKSLLNKDPEKRNSFPAAMKDPVFQMHRRYGKINQVTSKESSGYIGMSFSSNSQHTHVSHASSNEPDQCKSQKEKKSKTVRSNNIFESHDDLSDNIRFGYKPYKVISQKHELDHVPYEIRYSKENETYMNERNTFVKEIVHSSNSVRKSPHQMEIGGKDLRVNSHKNNFDSGLSSSCKSQSTHTSSIGPNQHRFLRNNNIVGSHDNLSDNSRFGYQSHQEISQKQRSDHAAYQDKNLKENKFYMDERNMFVKDIVQSSNNARECSHQMEIGGNDLRDYYYKSNDDRGVSLSSKSQSTHTFDIGPYQLRSLRNNNIAGSHDNFCDNTRFGYQSYQEISQKQRFDHAPYQDRQIEENKNYTGVQNTVVESLKDRIDPLNTIRLKPQRREIKNTVMISILNNGTVCVEVLKYKKTRKYVNLFYVISYDGLKIDICKPKKKILLNPDKPACSLPVECEVEHFNFENLPKKEGIFNHWRNYDFAKQFVDIIRGTTVKITIYSQNGNVIKMMENTPNPTYIMKSYNGFEISEKNRKLIIKDQKGCVVTEKDCSSSLLEEFEHLKKRCLMQEENTKEFQESTFPVTLGTKRNLRTIPDDDKENSAPAYLQSPSVNGTNSSVPFHIITTNSFNTFPRSTSISYSGMKSTSIKKTIPCKSKADIHPYMQDLKIEDEWIITEYKDGIQMWLSLENDEDVFFKDAKTQMKLSMRDNPELKDRYENDFRKILCYAVKINKT